MATSNPSVKVQVQNPSCCRCYTTAADAADGVADDGVAAAVAVSPRKTFAVLARLKAAAPSPPPPVSERVLMLLLLFLGWVLSITKSWEAKRGNKWNGCSMYGQLPPYNNIPAVEVLAPLSRTLPPSLPTTPFFFLLFLSRDPTQIDFRNVGRRRRTSPGGHRHTANGEHFFSFSSSCSLFLFFLSLLIVLLFCFFLSCGCG
jgi:hypothetical protein